ncbi:MAG: pitrilysin family protein [Phycisphaerales bacterium]|nr:pitrilysin family protein [Phycisphaerales bacterium]
MRALRKAAISVAAILMIPASTSIAQNVQPIEYTLDNGMKFLLMPRDEQPNVITAGWIANVGSVNERPGITGVSHFLEHLLFKGTDTVGTSDAEQDQVFRDQLTAVRKNMRAYTLDVQYQRMYRGEIENPWDPANDTDELREMRSEMTRLQDEQSQITIKNEFDSLYTGNGGSGMNAGTSQDFTVFYINVPSNKLELWAWMESDRLISPSLRELDAERFVVIEERRQRLEATATGKLGEQFDSMFWVASPYNWPVIGWMSDLMSYTEGDIREYFETYYQPANLTGVIVGDFDPADAKQLVESYFGRIPNRRPKAAPLATYSVPLLGEIRFSGECDCQNQVEVRYRSVPFGHPDEAVFDVMADLLNGRTGRLYKSLVEDQGIATGANASNRAQHYAGSFSFSARPKGNVELAELEAAWYEQLELLKTELVSDRELQKVKNGQAADTFRGLQDNSSLFFQISITEAYGGYEYLNEHPTRIAAVTAEDIMRVANEYFSADARAVASYTRRGGAEEVLLTIDDVRDSLPEDMVEMVVPQLEMQITALASETDASGLQAQLDEMEAQQGMVPPQFQTAMKFVKQQIEKRISEIESGSDSAEQGGDE